MRAGRWVAVVVLAVFGIAVAIWAVLPWDDHRPLAVPKGTDPQSAVFHCGAVFGSASVKGPEKTPYPVVGMPCEDRKERQRLVVADLAIAVVGIGLVLGSGRAGRSEPQPVSVA